VASRQAAGKVRYGKVGAKRAYLKVKCNAVEKCGVLKSFKAFLAKCLQSAEVAVLFLLCSQVVVSKGLWRVVSTERSPYERNPTNQSN
jgi:hypothetical protein